MADVPIVFISYSHDSPAHKQWVAEFASSLRHKGVDVILDQWDLPPGADAARFMEEGVTRAGRVLVICTPEYVRKANEGTGGVGYEKLIITAELVQDLGGTKFIPVIRQGDGNGPTTKPKFLGTRIHIDQRDGVIEEEFEKLLRELHQAPAASKPPLGKNPFAVTPSGAEASPGPPAPSFLPRRPRQRPVTSIERRLSLLAKTTNSAGGCSRRACAGLPSKAWLPGRALS